MEYIFGTNGQKEILKTKWSAHTNLTGYQQVERSYASQIITDNFRVIRKLKTDEDTEGNCYDWYEIDRHYRTIDKTGPIKKIQEQNKANIDYLSMMTGFDIPNDDGSANKMDGDSDE